MRSIPALDAFELQLTPMNSTPTWLCMEWPSVLRPDVLAREEHHGGGVQSLGAQHRGRAVRGGARDDGRAPGDRLRGVGSRRGDAAAAEHAAGDAATRGSVRASRHRRRARGCVGRVTGRDSGVDEYTCAQCVYFKTKQLGNSMSYSSHSAGARVPPSSSKSSVSLIISNSAASSALNAKSNASTTVLIETASASTNSTYALSLTLP